MTPSLEIRLAAAGDLDEVAELASARTGGERGAWVERLAEDLVGEDQGLWVADHAGQVVAYGRAQYFRPPAIMSPRTAPEGFYLIGLVIADSFRRQGIGQALTGARLDWISLRADEAWYFTNARNVASLNLHAQAGFREVTRDFEYPGVVFDGGVGVLAKVDLAIRSGEQNRR